MREKKKKKKKKKPDRRIVTVKNLMDYLMLTQGEK